MGTFAIISLIMSVLMTGAGIYAQHRANEQAIEQNNLNREDTQQFNAEEAEKARQANIDQYNLLYSPQAKVQQYKEAGLSPALMYSGGGAASAGGQTQMASAGMAGTPTINPIIPQNGLLDLLQQQTEIKKTKTEAQKNETEIEVKQAEIEKIESTINLNNATINEITSQTNLNNVRTQNEAIDGQIKQLDFEYSRATQSERITIVTQTLDNLQKENEKLLGEIENSEIEKNNKQKLYNAQLQKYKAETAKILKEKLLVEAETELTKSKDWLTQNEAKLNYVERQKKWEEISKLEAEISVCGAQVAKLISDVDLNNTKEISEIVGQFTSVVNAAKGFTPKTVNNTNYHYK